MSIGTYLDAEVLGPSSAILLWTLFLCTSRPILLTLFELAAGRRVSPTLGEKIHPRFLEIQKTRWLVAMSVLGLLLAMRGIAAARVVTTRDALNTAVDACLASDYGVPACGYPGRVLGAQRHLTSGLTRGGSG